jgi:hypothetical protein
VAYTSFKDLNFKGKIEHIWFYYKWYIVAALFFGFALFVCIQQTLLTPNYDATVLWARHGNVSPQTIEEMRTELESCCLDTNGDGEVHVDVRFIGLSETALTKPVSTNETSSGDTSSVFVNNQIELSYKMKLIAEVTGGESYIFILDDMVYNTLSDLNGYRDLSEFGERAVDARRINIKDTKIGENEKFGDMYFCFCSPNATKIRNQKEYENAFSAFKAIIG